MARKGALMPRTSSSLIPAKPERHPSYHLSSSRSENINFQTLSSIPESISLWPAISFIHFFLLNWKRRVLKKNQFQIANLFPEAVWDWMRGDLVTVWGIAPWFLVRHQLTYFSIKMSEYFFPLRVTCFSMRDRMSSWYSWGCAATWVETLDEAVVRPLMADIEGCRNWTAVRVLAAWVEDFLRWTNSKKAFLGVEKVVFAQW